MLNPASGLAKLSVLPARKLPPVLATDKWSAARLRTAILPGACTVPVFVMAFTAAAILPARELIMPWLLMAGACSAKLLCACITGWGAAVDSRFEMELPADRLKLPLLTIEPRLVMSLLALRLRLSVGEAPKKLRRML